MYSWFSCVETEEMLPREFTHSKEFFSFLQQALLKLCNVNRAQSCVLQDHCSGDAQTLSIAGLLSIKLGLFSDMTQAVNTSKQFKWIAVDNKLLLGILEEYEFTRAWILHDAGCTVQECSCVVRQSCSRHPSDTRYSSLLNAVMAQWVKHHHAVGSVHVRPDRLLWRNEADQHRCSDTPFKLSSTCTGP